MPTDEFTAADRELQAAVLLGPLAALDAGMLAIHAVAFAASGRGTVVTGASGTGKTAVLLAALAHGAELVAAEHAYLDQAGRLIGRSEAVRVRPRHRHLLPAPVRRDYGRVLTAWAPLDRASVGIGRLPMFAPAVAHRVRERVRDRAWVDVPADRFREARQPVSFDTLLLLSRADQPGKQAEADAMTVDAACARLADLFNAELAAGEAAIAGAPPPNEAQTSYRRLAGEVLRGRRLLHARIPPGELTGAAASRLATRVLARSSR